jgi:anti-sigma regulatory factor (Ser/Thr protein kinase)
VNRAAHRSFARDYASLEAIFEFTSGFFSRHRIDPQLLTSVDFVLEELFTNMVKYAAADDPSSEVRIDMEAVDGGVEVALTDYGVDAFDVTQAPDARVDLPAAERKPGGLGIHLTRRLVDDWRYDYSKERREGRITFRKTASTQSAPARATTKGTS